MDRYSYRKSQSAMHLASCAWPQQCLTVKPELSKFGKQQFAAALLYLPACFAAAARAADPGTAVEAAVQQHGGGAAIR